MEDEVTDSADAPSDYNTESYDGARPGPLPALPVEAKDGETPHRLSKRIRF